MMIYRSTNAVVRSPDWDIDFFDIFIGILHGNTLAPYLFILCQGYDHQTSIDLKTENRFTLKK